jgi:hypothetical protein
MPYEHMTKFKHYLHNNFVSALETKIVSHSPLLQSEGNLEAGKTAGNLPQKLTQKLTVKYIVNLTEDFKGMQC